GESLNVAALDVAEPLATERRKESGAERALVAADRARLVEVARLRPDLARAHAVEEFLSRFGQRDRRRRPELAPMDRGLRLGAAGAGGCERREGLAEPLLVARAPCARLVRRAAVAPPAVARCARLRVTYFDPRELAHDPHESTPARQSARQCATVESGSQ